MSSGQCLCRSVTWKISGEPEDTYHCHCTMCRKAHGAAFGTYYFMLAENFRWTSSLDTVVKYASSPVLDRAFCRNCGSVVPDSGGDSRFVYVPAGCHDEGAKIGSHIFTASKAPWYEITGTLPQFEDFPPGVDQEVIADKALPAAPNGVVRGSCLCGAIEFHVIEPFKIVHNCHCSRCRQARAAVHTTNGFTSMHGVQFIKGEERIAVYKVPEARFFTHAFCDTCGSGMPRIDAQREIAIIPLGALDDDPVARAVDNIFVADKASWYDITDDLPAYEQGPPG